MNRYITIDDRKIGPNHLPYIIAKLSANHYRDVSGVLKIMEETKETVLSRTATQDIERGKPLCSEHIEDFSLSEMK
ncbi:hypothetical protein [Vibrio barjaei]|jgi:sialic acid synthase SpsE|uniref:hypothetical protein n=1 Tax=Vibrio barjaei TaxID=1676683 RepID=UPI002284D948|nr:hypothetical protein [Vibrio barjaei]MCY9872526.1 hypothetical protein [Vibrio barjaei]